MVFVDGQNLFNAAKAAFGYPYPNYDPVALADRVCAANGWTRSQIRFYTGMPGAAEDPRRHRFWTNKLVVLRRQGVHVFTRPIRYRDKVTHWPLNVRICPPGGPELPSGTTLHLADGSLLPADTQFRVRGADEKGVDIRLAIDIFKLALEDAYDLALVFSQDQDLSEVAEEIPVLARSQRRWIRIACAFPDSPTAANHRGINRTQWVVIDQATYDACIDPFDYRTGVPPAPRPSAPPAPPPGGSSPPSPGS
ncbi:MAG TPA: NYN domain-containing protein [Gemmataceae bacterium]|nr:NYN domain-containing protein [Gemmataceae bacterium]